MGSNWNPSSGTVNTSTWTRSWRQELRTDLGSDFTLTANVEEVTVLETGEVIHSPLPNVVRSLSQVGTDPRVIQLVGLLTELIKEYLDEDQAEAKPATVDAAPIPAPDTDHTPA